MHPDERLHISREQIDVPVPGRDKHRTARMRDFIPGDTGRAPADVSSAVGLFLVHPRATAAT